MSQLAHQMIATVLLVITSFAINIFFPFEQEKAYWKRWFKNKE